MKRGARERKNHRLNATRASAARAMVKEQMAARRRLWAFSIEKGSPRRIVCKTRRPCQRITAVQMPETTRNSVSDRLAVSCQNQNQARKLAAAPAATISSSPG